MKRILSVLSICALMCGCSSADKNISLSFAVDGASSGEVVVACQNKLHHFPLNEDGTAEAVISGVDAAYLKVFYGMSQMKIYAEKGDRATVRFNVSDPEGSFVFEGKKKEAVEYLKNVTLTALPDDAFALGFGEYVSELEDKRDDALKLLAANDIKGAGNFVEMEQARIRYSYATPLLMYPVGHMLMSQDMSYVPDDEYYDALDRYFVEDDRYVDIDEYRNFIIEAAHVLDAKNRDVKELNAKTVAQMRYITDRFTSEKVTSSLLHYLASSYVDTFGIDGIEEMLSIYRTYVKDPALLEDFAAKYDKWDRSKPGKPSPDFKAVDLDGKEWTLADFKGKYVYIDMWATWCNPCKREFPHLKALEEKFRDAEIVFLGLSTDGNKENWEKMVRSGALSGTQLYLGPRSSFQLAYNITGIPRFILLDKDGVIISNNMTRPSAAETAATLESLEGIR